MARKQAFNAGGWGGIGRFQMQRQDQGQDFEIPVGHFITAPGDGEVIEHASDGPFPNGFGSPYAIVRIDTGRFAVGNGEWYVGHCNEDVAPVGTKLTLGDPIARANNSLNAGWGWCELGKWDNGPHPDGEGAQWAHLFTPLVGMPRFKMLHKGSRGPRVVHYTKHLAFIRKSGGNAYLPRWYWKFKAPVERAVRSFQRAFALKVDGQIGPKTAAKINAIFHRQRNGREHDHHAVVPAPPKPKPVKNGKKPSRSHLGDAIDVSSAQGSVDWEKVGHKVDVAFAKATEGVTYVDPRFSAERLKEMQANVRAGIYHFARPDNNSPSAEAEHFVKTVRATGGKFISYKDWKAGKPGIVGWLDFETAPFSRQWAASFAKKFKALTGVECGLNGYGSSLNPILYESVLKHFFGIWFAAYVSDWTPYLNRHHDRVLFWQDRDNWSCPGVSGAVDHSRFLG